MEAGRLQTGWEAVWSAARGLIHAVAGFFQQRLWLGGSTGLAKDTYYGQAS